jgi:hypothetical protein
MTTALEKNIELFNKQNAICIDFKLDHMARLFRKISHKRFECYVIQRIWHSLNDDRVKFVVQQYIRRDKEDKYALADLYLPQLGIIVEVNEAYHVATERQKEVDAIRKAEIAKTTDTIVKIVDCTKSISDIHAQIDEIVKCIRNKIKEKDSMGSFKPWGGEDTLTVEYHKNRGYVKVDDDEYFRTIDDICATFGTKAKHLGYIRAGGAERPNCNDYMLWFPRVVNSSGWHNELIHKNVIVEYNQNNDKNKKHIHNILDDYKKSTLAKRVTFLREKDELGFNFYRFVGVFELDYEQSIVQDRAVWKRIADEFPVRHVSLMKD